MTTIEKWSVMPALFWVLWGIEIVLMLWWLISELNLQHLSVNPVVYACWLYLLLALVLYLAKVPVIALVLVGIAALPLTLMAVFLIIVFIASIFGGPIRWN